MSAIVVDRLSKHFADVRAVRDASFEVPFGAVTGFIGGNGSGKTTTMRMILGLVQPTAGEALIAGHPMSQLAEPRRVVGSALDRLGAHPGLSATQHLQTVCAGARLDPATIVPSLEAVGLTDASNRKVSSYSTGMKQRLGLATAMLGDPPVLVLDEPASGLDPAGVRWLREMLRAKADAGAAVFVSTHQLAELSTIVDHVVVIDRGTILASEPAADLLVRTRSDRLENAVFALTDSTQLQDIS